MLKQKCERVTTSKKQPESRGDQHVNSHKEPQKPALLRICPGSAKGMAYFMADDFDAPLSEFGDFA